MGVGLGPKNVQTWIWDGFSPCLVILVSWRSILVSVLIFWPVEPFILIQTTPCHILEGISYFDLTPQWAYLDQRQGSHSLPPAFFCESKSVAWPGVHLPMSYHTQDGLRRGHLMEQLSPMAQRFSASRTRKRWNISKVLLVIFASAARHFFDRPRLCLTGGLH